MINCAGKCTKKKRSCFGFLPKPNGGDKNKVIGNRSAIVLGCWLTGADTKLVGNGNTWKRTRLQKWQHKNIYLVEKQIFDDEMVPVGPKLPVSSSFVGKSMMLSGECQNVPVPSINNSFPRMNLLWNWDFSRRNSSMCFGCGLISF